MHTPSLNILLAWAAYMSAGATIATLVTGILFFTRGERSGEMNDAASVFQMLLMLPIAVGLFALARPYGAASALVTAAIGITGMLTAAVLQALLVLGAVKYEQTIAVVPMAGGAVGLWLLLVNFLVSTARILPDGLAIPGAIAGAGYILSVVACTGAGSSIPCSTAARSWGS